MRKLGIWLVLAAMSAATPAAQAALKEGTLAPDIEAKEWLNTDHPVSIAELRGMIVVLYFWVSFHETGQAILPDMTLLDNNERFGRPAGVYVIGVTDADRKRIEEPVRKAKAFFPVALESKAYKEYDLLNFPQVVIIDPQGKVAWTGWPGDTNGMLQAVSDVMTKTPPTRTHPREAALCTEYIQQTRERILAGKLRDAYAVAKKANKHALSGDPLKARCQEYVDLLESLGQDQLATGERALVTNRFDEAVAILNRCARDFNGLESGRRARIRLLALAKERPEVQTLVDAQSKENDALRKMAVAVQQVEAQRFAEAYATSEDVVKTAPGTPAAGYAATLMKRMEQHPTLKKLVLDSKAARECEPLLAQARADQRQKRYSQARSKLERIVREFPDTSYADDARRLLIEMP
jgi:peroxiredoxin